MKAYAIVFIVFASVAFTTCNLLCCLCSGRGGRIKKPSDVEEGVTKTTTSIGSRATRDEKAGTAVATGSITSDDKRDRDKDNSKSGGSCGAAVGGGGTDNSGTSHGCCCDSGGGCGGGCGGCGG
ncbi:unnamed protein product [Withania somnifera]